MRGTMKAVFLDFSTLGPDELDPEPLLEVLPGLKFFDSTEPEVTSERIREAEFVLTNKIRLDEDLLSSAKRLKFIGLTATGTDNVDLAVARKLDIAVTNIRAYCTRSVVEHVFGVVLSLTHNLNRYHHAVRKGDWRKADVFCLMEYPIRELSAMTLGIVGYGELGRGVADMARTFGMRTLITRRRGAPAADDGRTAFDEVLERSDVVSLHCPLTGETQNLLGAAEFRRMKRNTILVNTARGGLVDSQALVDALREGRLGGAGIDVLRQEPPVHGDPLLDYEGDNLILTPHIAWATVEARQNAVNELAKNVSSFISGERRNRVV